MMSLLRKLGLAAAIAIAPLTASAQIGSPGGSGITALTGDVTAGPGTGSQAATLATAQPGAHTWAAQQTINFNTAAAPTPITGLGLQVVAADGVTARVANYSFGAIAVFTAARANGTNASKTGLVNNDQIGGFNYYGYTSAGAYAGPAGSVQGFATETWSATANGSKIILAVTPNTTTTLTTAVTVDQDLRVTHAGATTLSAALTYGGVALSNAVTGTGNMVLSASPTLTGTITIGDGPAILTSPTAAVHQFGAADANLNATIVAQKLKIQSLTAGGTNNQAGKDFTIDLSGSTGSAAGGSLLIRGTSPGSSGSTLNSYATIFSIDRDGNTVAAGTLGSGTLTSTGDVVARSSLAIPAGGTAGRGFRFSSTANFGMFFGSGAPSLAAGKGSIYLRSDGTGATDRMYVNTDGSTAWTNVVTGG